MELRHFRHVLALAEHENYHRAAEALGITQPALTKSIQQLERELDARLFERDGRQVVATEVGRMLAEAARDIATRIDTLTRQIPRNGARPAARLSVGVGPYVADVWLGPIAGRVLKGDPGLRLDVVVEHWTKLPDLLREGRVELFCANVEHVANLAEFRVVEAPLQKAIWVARSGHPLVGRVVTRELLVGYTLVGPPAPESIRIWLDAGGKGPPVLERKIDTTSVEFLKSMIREADALSLVHAGMVHRELRNGEIVELDVDGPKLLFRAGVVWLADRPLSGAGERFVEEFRREVCVDDVSVR